MASQNLHYKFLTRIFNVIFSPRSSVFDTHFQEPSTLKDQDLQWTPLNRNIIIIHLQNQIFDAKIRLQKEFLKNINY